MFKELISPVANIFGIYVKGWVNKAQAETQLKVDKAKAESKVMERVTEGEIEWDQTMAKASAESWKDEWLTILVSIPLVLAFTGNTEAVVNGFAALDSMPAYYQKALAVVFAASFGIQKLTQMFKATKAKGVS